MPCEWATRSFLITLSPSCVSSGGSCESEPRLSPPLSGLAVTTDRTPQRTGATNPTPGNCSYAARTSAQVTQWLRLHSGQASRPTCGAAVHYLARRTQRLPLAAVALQCRRQDLTNTLGR